MTNYSYVLFSLIHLSFWIFIVNSFKFSRNTAFSIGLICEFIDEIVRMAIKGV